VAEVSGLDAEQIRLPSKQPERARARSMVCYLAVSELGVTTMTLSKVLGICQSAASKSAFRGRQHAKEFGIDVLRK
jgi:hypothetical protein